MKVAEVLRALLNAIDQAEIKDAVPQARDDVQNFAQPHSVETQNAEDPHDLFLPPLQMKLELLKKAVGVENVYDDGPDSEHQLHDEVGAPDTERESSFESELSQIKKAAGINPAVMQELSNDEPMDD